MGTKHEEFYFDKTGEVLTLSELIECIKTDKTFSRYRNSMYCAECRKPKLNLTQPVDRAPYLSTYKNDPHDQNCILEVKPITKKVAEKHFDLMKDDNEIKSLINQLLTKELKRAIDAKDKQKNPVSSLNLKDPHIIKVKTSKSVQKKRLPKKLLTNDLSYETNGDSIYVFYGKVKLQVEHKIANKNHAYTYNILHISVKKREDWTRVARVYRKQIVDQVDPDKEYHIALIGSLSKEFAKDIRLVNKNMNAIEFVEA